MLTHYHDVGLVTPTGADEVARSASRVARIASAAPPLSS
jgi:hypothetical protein